MNYLRFLLFSAFIILSLLLVLNNALDLRYVIEPFNEGSNLLAFKSLVEDRLRNNCYIVILNLGLITVYGILGIFMKTKKPIASIKNETILDDL